MDNQTKLNSLIALARFGLSHGNPQVQKDANNLLANLNNPDLQEQTLKKFSEGDIMRMIANLNKFAQNNKHIQRPKYDAFGRTNS